MMPYTIPHRSSFMYRKRRPVQRRESYWTFYSTQYSPTNGSVAEREHPRNIILRCVKIPLATLDSFFPYYPPFPLHIAHNSLGRGRERTRETLQFCATKWEYARALQMKTRFTFSIVYRLAMANPRGVTSLYFTQPSQPVRYGFYAMGLDDSDGHGDITCILQIDLIALFRFTRCYINSIMLRYLIEALRSGR